jgi:hypothetical protein
VAARIIVVLSVRVRVRHFDVIKLGSAEISQSSFKQLVLVSTGIAIDIGSIGLGCGAAIRTI